MALLRKSSFFLVIPLSIYSAFANAFDEIDWGKFNINARGAIYSANSKKAVLRSKMVANNSSLSAAYAEDSLKLQRNLSAEMGAGIGYSLNKSLELDLAYSNYSLSKSSPNQEYSFIDGGSVSLFTTSTVVSIDYNYSAHPPFVSLGLGLASVTFNAGILKDNQRIKFKTVTPAAKLEIGASKKINEQTYLRGGLSIVKLGVSELKEGDNSVRTGFSRTALFAEVAFYPAKAASKFLEKKGEEAN